ncbi:unnamed protein product [Schistosoma curassoni]|uniref:Uncharacterized protein n=1 Tax=Schistosoma curassoni TaxID=6186 RepID=A0A183JFG7_9TREM|nr:unnamed protein product [Schistosoma curassoni]
MSDLHIALHPHLHLRLYVLAVDSLYGLTGSYRSQQSMVMLKKVMVQLSYYCYYLH